MILPQRLVLKVDGWSRRLYSHWRVEFQVLGSECLKSLVMSSRLDASFGGPVGLLL